MLLINVQKMMIAPIVFDGKTDGDTESPSVHGLERLLGSDGIGNPHSQWQPGGNTVNGTIRPNDQFNPGSASPTHATRSLAAIPSAVSNRPSALSTAIATRATTAPR